MSSPNLGHAVILNSLALEVPDTIPDVQALQEILQTLGFKVKLHSSVFLNVQVAYFVICQTNTFLYMENHVN